MQHLFPWGVTIGVDYSASRSTHLPFSSYSGTANRNFLPSSIRNQIVADVNAGVPVLPDNPDCNTPSTILNCQVANPFLSLFQGPNAIFNEPESIYNDETIPLINVLRPYPQFDGAFSGLTRLEASANYNSLQVRFQKRPSKYISFEGNYTFSKAIDNSSAGANSFITSSLEFWESAGTRQPEGGAVDQRERCDASLCGCGHRECAGRARSLDRD